MKIHTELVFVTNANTGTYVNECRQTCGDCVGLGNYLL